jgi:threonine dehydratase
LEVAEAILVFLNALTILVKVLAAAVAAALHEKPRNIARKIAFSLSGGNYDRELFASLRKKYFT